MPTSSWIAIAWREDDDELGTGARTALDRLLKDAHTEPDEGGEIDWPSWRAYAAALDEPHLTMVSLTPGQWALGHSTNTASALVQQDGTLIAD
ncbi:hypothetical protein ACTWQF_09960 [Streptomyces sp. 8N114]|uniref:hypothetical protein n=1 Tax=Streptomyces sp. 8N114 TaxID=3457419 RepID=UPI003FD56214